MINIYNEFKDLEIYIEVFGKPNKNQVDYDFLFGYEGRQETNFIKLPKRGRRIGKNR